MYEYNCVQCWTLHVANVEKKGRSLAGANSKWERIFKMADYTTPLDKASKWARVRVPLTETMLATLLKFTHQMLEYVVHSGSV